jgi:molybdopterin converting factor small subunit
MRVNIPSPLRSYTNNRTQVEAGGGSLAEVLADLERNYPGIRFRMIDEQGGIRPHIRLFVNQDLARELSVAVSDNHEIHIICALSGG